MKKIENIKKIVIAGLENGGKTSIVYNLKGTKNLPSYLKIKPTVGKSIVNFDSYDSEFNVWDLGGQETYRNENLKDFNNIMKDANKLIYVIDIQDVERYQLAVEYFKIIIDTLNKNNNKQALEISIFLHKFDPDLNDTRPDITDNIIQGLKDQIKKIIEKTDFFYQIFKTSVYVQFERHVTD
jgi:small GTP-binding protein